MNNEQLLKQAKEFCNYSATHSETPELASFWTSLAETFAAAESDFKQGRASVYRHLLIDAARHLNLDITRELYDIDLTVDDPE